MCNASTEHMHQRSSPPDSPTQEPSVAQWLGMTHLPSSRTGVLLHTDTNCVLHGGRTSGVPAETLGADLHIQASRQHTRHGVLDLHCVTLRCHCNRSVWLTFI